MNTAGSTVSFSYTRRCNVINTLGVSTNSCYLQAACLQTIECVIQAVFVNIKWYNNSMKWKHIQLTADGQHVHTEQFIWKNLCC